MSQTSSPSASAVVETAALLMAVPVLLLPMKAAAQQMGLGGPAMAKCDQIKDHAKSAQCTNDALIEDLRQRNEDALRRQREAAARSTVAQQTSSAANEEKACADKIMAEVKTGRITPDALREALAGRPVREVGGCNLLAKLTRS